MAGLALTLALAGCSGQPASSGDVSDGASGEGTESTEQAAYDTDKVLARWSAGGASGEVLAGEVERGMSVEGKATDPAAEIVLERARIEIIASQASEQASDEDALAWVNDSTGYSDVASWANNLQIDEKDALEVARTAATANNWLAKEAGTPEELTWVGRPDLPEAPTGDADIDARTEEYLNYIKGLAGDKYDDKEAGWSELVKGEGGATYDEAMAAYSKAYENWAGARWEAQNAEDDIANQVLESAKLELESVRR